MALLTRTVSRGGFSLAEVLIAVVVMMIVIVNLIQLFVYCSKLADTSENFASAVSQAQDKLEEIRNSDYSTITTNYAFGGTPGDTFNLTQFTGKGAITVDSSNADLLQVRIVVSWRNKDGRIVGEDNNLNGSLDAGEDVNINGQLDSPAILLSLIARR